MIFFCALLCCRRLCSAPSCSVPCYFTLYCFFLLLLLLLLFISSLVFNSSIASLARNYSILCVFLLHVMIILCVQICRDTFGAKWSRDGFALFSLHLRIALFMQICTALFVQPHIHCRVPRARSSVHGACFFCRFAGVAGSAAFKSILWLQSLRVPIAPA